MNSGPKAIYTPCYLGVLCKGLSHCVWFMSERFSGVTVRPCLWILPVTNYSDCLQPAPWPLTVPGFWFSPPALTLNLSTDSVTSCQPWTKPVSDPEFPPTALCASLHLFKHFCLLCLHFYWNVYVWKRLFIKLLHMDPSLTSASSHFVIYIYIFLWVSVFFISHAPFVCFSFLYILFLCDLVNRFNLILEWLDFLSRLHCIITFNNK